jgi:hypothetical protein
VLKNNPTLFVDKILDIFIRSEQHLLAIQITELDRRKSDPSPIGIRITGGELENK